MITVFISSENEDSDALSVFLLLNRAAKVSAVFDNFVKISEDADFLLVSPKNGSIKVKSHCAAVLFDNKCLTGNLPEGCSVLCFGAGAELHCSGQGRQIISCGMHNKDTVTLSSLESEKPVLSLQRRLISFSGEAVEAGDYPLITSENNQKALIAAVTLLLLGGYHVHPKIFCD